MIKEMLFFSESLNGKSKNSNKKAPDKMQHKLSEYEFTAKAELMYFINKKKKYEERNRENTYIKFLEQKEIRLLLFSDKFITKLTRSGSTNISSRFFLIY